MQQWVRATNGPNSRYQMRAIPYTCSYCGFDVAPDWGYYSESPGGQSGLSYSGQISICPHCTSPTYLPSSGGQFPGAAFGGSIEHLPKEVAALYDEARNCIKVNAYTAAAMCCRKLLMNVSVAHEAAEGKPFAWYVDWLVDEGHLPGKAKPWVTVIKDKGNEANHEIRILGLEDAERLLKFSEMMLKMLYEYPVEVDEANQKAAGSSKGVQNPPETPQPKI